MTEQASRAARLRDIMIAASAREVGVTDAGVIDTRAAADIMLAACSVAGMMAVSIPLEKRLTVSTHCLALATAAIIGDENVAADAFLALVEKRAREIIAQIDNGGGA